VTEDVVAILDALGVARFATYGRSGGGPHALACGALLGGPLRRRRDDRRRRATDAPDLDWLAGMGEGNHAEVAAAREGRDGSSPTAAPTRPRSRRSAPRSSWTRCARTSARSTRPS
jgi:pimeloyl-ACP methyl ester carboxylesterase